MQIKAIELSSYPQADGSILYQLQVGVFTDDGTQVFGQTVPVAGADLTSCTTGLNQVQTAYLATQAAVVALPGSLTQTVS